MHERIDPHGDLSKIIEERGPFKVVSSEILHYQYGMQFIADEVINPDGSKGKHYWVNFPHQAVLIFPLDNEGNIYLAQEFNYPANKYSNEVSGGVIDEGETPEEAACREVKEELGIEVAQSLGFIGITEEVTNRVNNVSHLFLAKVERVGKATPEPGEVIKLKKVPFEEAYKMVLNGEITTATIKAGILQIKLLLDSLKKLGS